MQFSLPIAYEPEIFTSRIWLAAAERGQVDAIAARLQSRSHTVVNCEGGRGAVAPEDIILLHDPSRSAFRAFGPVGSDANSVSDELSRIIEISKNIVVRERSQEVVGIFLGEQGRNSWSPDVASNRLERALATLRHRQLAKLPEVRADRCRAALGDLSFDADTLLRAVLELELIDATSGGSLEQKPYVEWANKFEALGKHRLAQRPRVRNGEKSDARTANLFGWTDKEFNPPAFRVGYRVFPMLVQKLTVSKLMLRTDTSAGAFRPELTMKSVPQAQICAWIRGATSDRLQPFVRCSSIESNGKGYELAAGLDAEIAVRLSVGGRAGVKEGVCEVRAFSSSCRIIPDRLNCSIGETALFQVSPARARAGIVDVEFNCPPYPAVTLRSHLSRFPWN